MLKDFRNSSTLFSKRSPPENDKVPLHVYIITRALGCQGSFTYLLISLLTKTDIRKTGESGDGSPRNQGTVPMSRVVDYISAGISGGLVASGIGTAGAVIANAALGGTTHLANCAIEGKDANLRDFGIATGIGAVCVRIGGSGANSGKLIGVTKTAKQVLKTAVSPKKLPCILQKR